MIDESAAAKPKVVELKPGHPKGLAKYPEAVERERKTSEEMAQFRDTVTRHIVQPLLESMVYCAVVNESYLTSVNCALQLGMAILLKKPVCLIIDKKLTEIPVGLVRTSDHIQKIDVDDEMEFQRAMNAVEQFAIANEAGGLRG